MAASERPLPEGEIARWRRLMVRGGCSPMGDDPTLALCTAMHSADRFGGKVHDELSRPGIRAPDTQAAAPCSIDQILTTHGKQHVGPCSVRAIAEVRDKLAGLARENRNTTGCALQKPDAHRLVKSPHEMGAETDARGIFSSAARGPKPIHRERVWKAACHRAKTRRCGLSAVSAAWPRASWAQSSGLENRLPRGSNGNWRTFVR